ncbi:MAG: hypothetical protein ABIH74_06350, partial [Candidatus Omnitrophota bacterium]
FMATLLYQYMASTGEKASGELDEMKKACRARIPQTVRCMDEVKKLLGRRKNDAAYEKLLDITSVFRAETGKCCVVILDEFHNLSNFRLKNPFGIFGKYIMVQKNTMYIVSSSQRTLLKEILSKRLSLLFGNFEVIDVNGFDSQTARSFISDRVKDTDPDGNIRNYLIQVSQGSPFYLEALSTRFAHLVSEKHGKGDVKECLLDAFAELLYASDGVLNQYFENTVNFFLEKKARTKFLPVLLSLARGNSTVKSIQEDLATTGGEIGAKLQALQEMDLVFSSGVFYKITEKLFEYWLKHVYSLRTRAIADDMDIKYLEFKNSMAKDYELYRVFNAKDVGDVMCDLFRSFNNEKIQIRMNSRKMPKFDAVKSSALSENVFQITGSIQNKKWACRLKRGDIADEQDICALWDFQGPGDKANIVRKIFVPLNGIEQNAFLLAKEQNIWVWDVQLLNRILRLFGKFELTL